MTPLFKNRLLIVLLLNAILALALYQCNVWIAPHGLHLVLDALFIVFAGFYLRLRHVLLLAILLGMLSDAIRPVPYGVGILPYLGAAGLIAVFRNRLHREMTSHIRLVALALNCVFLVYYSALHAPTLLSTGTATVWVRVATDALVSLLVVLLVTPFWISFQKWYFQRCGIDLSAELHRST